MTITLEDLIKAGKSEVRYNSNLLTAYKKLFAEKFGREPDCAGCTFDSDWNRLTNQNFSNREIMSENTFKLRDNSIIYTYDKKIDDGNTRRTRSYGNIMTEEFAEAYLTEGTPEQIDQRKKQFKILPKKFRESDGQLIPSLIETEVSVLKDEALQKGYPEEEFKDIFDKDHMVAYMDGKSLELVDEKDLIAAAEKRMADQREGNLVKQEPVSDAVSLTVYDTAPVVAAPLFQSQEKEYEPAQENVVSKTTKAKASKK